MNPDLEITVLRSPHHGALSLNRYDVAPASAPILIAHDEHRRSRPTSNTLSWRTSMTTRSKPPQVEPEIHAHGDDDQSSVTGIDELIARLRAAYDRGITIEEFHARLGSLLATPTSSLWGKSVPVGFPSPEPHSHDPETRLNPCSNRESNPPENGSSSSTGQSPFTRSTPSQHPETSRLSSRTSTNKPSRVTHVGHSPISDVSLRHSEDCQSYAASRLTKVL